MTEPEDPREPRIWKRQIKIEIARKGYQTKVSLAGLIIPIKSMAFVADSPGEPYVELKIPYRFIELSVTQEGENDAVFDEAGREKEDL
ncbi:MAG: hypothetical protein GY896_22875 [Gammaproteobacteria bacterium]|nr:hypothetical protein [Gammaproteobacteria bacterium]